MLSFDEGKDRPARVEGPGPAPGDALLAVAVLAAGHLRRVSLTPELQLKVRTPVAEPIAVPS